MSRRATARRGRRGSASPARRFAQRDDASVHIRSSAGERNQSTQLVAGRGRIDAGRDEHSRACPAVCASSAARSDSCGNAGSRRRRSRRVRRSLAPKGNAERGPRFLSSTSRRRTPTSSDVEARGRIAGVAQQVTRRGGGPPCGEWGTRSAGGGRGRAGRPPWRMHQRGNRGDGEEWVERGEPAGSRTRRSPRTTAGAVRARSPWRRPCSTATPIAERSRSPRCRACPIGAGCRVPRTQPASSSCARLRAVPMATP